MIDDALRSEFRHDVLPRFTRDLTADARAGRLEPVRCRDQEVARCIDILLRHGKNNPTLVGPAGVGKTAIAEGLAQRIALGSVPVALRNIRLLSLDHIGLLAGTTYRGDYEARLRSIIAETVADGNIVLFIDELHNLIGQGTGRDTAMDAANMLKPALVRGDFRVLGATTDDEYDRWIGGDPALERRFQRIVVRELTDDESLEVLLARKERLERHHNVLITDDAVRAAIALTDLYVLDRLRPDKAIDALDEACAHLQATASYSPTAEALIRTRLTLIRGVQPAEPQPVADDRFAAIELFNAGLEAMFGNTPQPAPGPQRPPARPVERSATTPGSLATVESELSRRLMEEGIVVRGHDVARVVGLMSGEPVSWAPEISIA